MARIFSIFILLVTVGVLAADTVKESCYDEVEYNKNSENYKSECREQTKIFHDAPGPTENKYSAFTVAWKKITSLTKTFIANNFAENNLSEKCIDKIMLSRYFEHLVRHTQAKSEINEKEYLTSTDPRILKKIVDKTTEIDACYENSRNLTGINPKDESKINFCSYNMDEALDCTKKIFKNDQDEPLLALNSFTNYFVTEYDCKEEDRGVIKDIVLLSLYEGLADTKKWPGRQTFFHGYQQALKDFTKFD